MMCSKKLHLYDVDQDGKRATCLCGKGEPIVVPAAPDWAAGVADLVDADEWAGTIDSHDLSISWAAAVHDRAYDGSCEHWRVDDGVVELEVGGLRLQWEGDHLSTAEAIAGLRRAMIAFG
jgi:hypothetical protein